MTNESGIRPLEYNVLISQDIVEEKTAAGLWKPQDTLERDKHAQTLGTLVDVSPMAFTFDDWPDGEPRPQPGQRVVFARHAGTFVTGKDGKEYRVVKDKDVVGVME